MGLVSEARPGCSAFAKALRMTANSEGCCLTWTLASGPHSFALQKAVTDGGYVAVGLEAYYCLVGMAAACVTPWPVRHRLACAVVAWLRLHGRRKAQRMFFISSCASAGCACMWVIYAHVLRRQAQGLLVPIKSCRFGNKLASVRASVRFLLFHAACNIMLRKRAMVRKKTTTLENNWFKVHEFAYDLGKRV